MRARCAIAVLLLAAVVHAPAVGESHPEYEVIVHPATAVQTMDRKFLADAFLKKITRWDDDAQMRPVDQAPDSALRQRFSQDVLERSVTAVKSYWQQLIFSGRSLPPPELEGDSRVVDYVVDHPGAVGYVTVGTALKGARVVSVR